MKGLIMGDAHRSFAMVGAIALALGMAGCQKQAAGGDADSAKKAIQADEKDWNSQFKAKDSEGIVGRYTDESFLAAPGADPAEGSTAIRKVYANALSDPAINVTFGSDKMDASGDLAYSRGHFTETFTDPKSGKVMTQNGAYLTLYKKQQDGSWKAVEDFAAADAGSQKPVEPGKPATRAKMTSSGF